MRDRPRCGACGQAMPPGAGRCPACATARVPSIDTITVDVAAEKSEAHSRLAGVVAIGVLGLLIAAVTVTGRPAGDTMSGRPAAGADGEAPTSSLELDAGVLPGPVARAWVVVGDTGEWVFAETPAAAGPLLGRPTGLSLLVGSANGFFTVDVDTGAYERNDGFAYELGPTNTVVQVTGGVVIVEEGRVGVHAAPFTGRVGAQIDTSGRLLHAIPADRPDRVWLVHGDPRSGREASEIDLAGRQTTPPLLLPEDGVPVTGMAGGLLLHAPDGGYVLGPDGSLRRVADGDVATGVGTEVLHQSCDEQLRCGWFLTSVESGRRRSVTGLDDAVNVDAPPNARSPDGTTLVLVVTRPNVGFDLAFLDVDTARATRVSVGATDGVPTRVTWTPAGDRVFWLSAQRLHTYRLGEPSAELVAFRPSDYRLVVPFATP